MANIIGIMGESGSGKTTSMRNLDPKTTYYIDCDKKGLSWRGWEKQRVQEAASAEDRSVASFVRMVLNEHFEKEAE